MLSALILASVIVLSKAKPYTDEGQIPCGFAQNAAYLTLFCCSDITEDGSGWMTSWIMAAAAGVALVMTTLACTCCRRPKGGFSEFRGSAQLSEIITQAGELTLFPPPWKIDERKAERPLVSFTRTSTTITCTQIMDEVIAQFIFSQNVVLNMIYSRGEFNQLKCIQSLNKKCRRRETAEFLDGVLYEHILTAVVPIPVNNTHA